MPLLLTARREQSQLFDRLHSTVISLAAEYVDKIGHRAATALRPAESHLGHLHLPKAPVQVEAQATIQILLLITIESANKKHKLSLSLTQAWLLSYLQRVVRQILLFGEFSRLFHHLQNPAIPLIIANLKNLVVTHCDRVPTVHVDLGHLDTLHAC